MTEVKFLYVQIPLVFSSKATYAQSLIGFLFDHAFPVWCNLASDFNWRIGRIWVSNWWIENDLWFVLGNHHLCVWVVGLSVLWSWAWLISAVEALLNHETVQTNHPHVWVLVVVFLVLLCCQISICSIFMLINIISFIYLVTFEHLSQVLQMNQSLLLVLDKLFFLLHQCGLFQFPQILFPLFLYRSSKMFIASLLRLWLVCLRGFHHHGSSGIFV